MKTILKGRHTELIIDTAGPVVLIGESINPTGRKKLQKCLEEGNYEYLIELARTQISAGADALDVNVGMPGVDEAKLLPEVVTILQDNFDIPLCLDSPNTKALEAALKVIKGKCLINSVNGEKSSMVKLIPLAKEYGSAIIGLTMDDKGISQNPMERLAIAERILEKALGQGMPEEDIIIDPLAMAVSADLEAGKVTLETIRLIRDKLKLNITMGASNISFGLPAREKLNSAFMVMAIMSGLSCPIANTSQIGQMIKAADLLLGKDDFAMRYVENYQKGLNK